jgi:hypothetical protein
LYLNLTEFWQRGNLNNHWIYNLHISVEEQHW